MDHCLQLRLPLNIRTPLTRELVQKWQKHKLIKGRPRRLVKGSQVIKVSIHPSKLEVIDRIRENLETTRPEAIRLAVEEFLERHKDSLPTVTDPPKLTGRCQYPKIPISPSAIKAIGHQEWTEGPPGDDKTIVSHPSTGLCKALNMTRQQVINLAVDEWIENMLGLKKAS